MIGSSSAHSAFDRQEPIPGYRTTELLGRGGYGEVWKAIAPGGIAKAIKIIYGDNDPTKAEGELRALARIKDVRHPLLLSIERIEMSAGNLVIVTELADGSLKDRFVELRKSQSVGIPQDELLRYIADAGEALDYLYESYSLQHLDVKPENILILSRRGKLGDFGLVKNLYERSASLVGGLTPTYAPPELFEGKPNRHSDQYGLAIVYSHMLTGMLPFPAGNTAQLAAAHLRGVPDLTALPRAQRPIIARALSKDPAQRFPSCLALITALRDALRSEEMGVAATPPPWKAVVAPPPARTSAPAPAVVPTAPASAIPEEANVPKTQVLAGAPPVVVRPVAAADTTQNKPHQTTIQRPAAAGAPIVLVGVGGLGVEVLGRLVNRLNDLYGPASQWPPVEMIVLDSHIRSLTSRFREQDLDRVHVVPIPLKAADAYGSQTTELLKWLGRRWFYNIPRDLTTNGFRPLGRLALVSNGQRVRAALTKVLGAAAKQAMSTGEPPRITVIGGVGGGTGSGAIPDLAYALRSELKLNGMPDDRLQGMLLHATPRSHAERDKSRANAYALLRELNHYSAPGSHYAGEPHLNAVPYHGDNAAFGELLLFNLGEGLGQTEWELGVEQAAEFLYAANFTRAEAHLHGRGGPAWEGDSSTSLQAHRTQVVALGAGGSAIISETMSVATDDVLRFWRDGRSPPEDDSGSANVKTLKLAALAPAIDENVTATDTAVRKQFTQCQLDVPHLTDAAREVIQLESGKSLADFLAEVVNQAKSLTADSGTGAARAAAAAGILDRCMQSDFNEEVDELGDDQLFLQIVGRLAVRVNGRIKALFDWIIQMVDNPDLRLEGARRHALAIQRHLQVLQLDALKQAQAETTAAQELGTSIGSEEFHRVERRGITSLFRSIDPEQKLTEALTSYAKIRLNEFDLRVTAKIARIIDAECTTLIEQLDRLARDLVRLSNLPSAASRDSDEGLSHTSSIVAAYRKMLREHLHLRRYEIARQIDDATQSEFAKLGKPLHTFLDPVADLHQAVWQPLIKIARKCVLDCVQNINHQLLAVNRKTSEASSMNRVLDLLRSELNQRSDNQAGTTSCLVIPEGTDASALGTLPAGTTIVEGQRIDITLCMVGPGAPLAELACELTGGVQTYQELGERLLSRVDMEWREFKDASGVATGHQDGEFTAQPTITPTAALPAYIPR